MRVTCAWCHKILRVHCTHCGMQLSQLRDTDDMICPQGAPITYSQEAIRQMPTTHTICLECSQPILDELKKRKEENT